jgi:MoxR-like ATPase
VLRERGHRRGSKQIALEIEKATNHEQATISMADSAEELVSLEFDPLSKKLVVGVKDGAPVDVVSGINKVPVITKASAAEVGNDDSRTWSIDREAGVFSCWLPNRNKVELPIEKEPGDYTPTETIPEVLGQPQLIFAIALGIKLGKHSLLSGPTGIAKTTAYRWMAQVLNYNLIISPIARGTESAHLVGEYLPVDEAGRFEWTDGPVTQAVRLSKKHKTILVFDEVNRIGNIAEFARIYSLLDDQRFLELKEKRTAGEIERIEAGELFIGATSNPSDDDHADYIGVQDLDPALNSRFALQPPLGYPLPEIEAKALMDRVQGLNEREALAMVDVATRIRQAENVRFPISFRELEAWALTLQFFGWKQSAEIAVVSKAAKMYHADIRNMLQLQRGGQPDAKSAA